jgi:transposase
MAQTLPSNATEERLRWIKPCLESKRSLKDISEISPFSYRTLKRWVANYRKYGIEGLMPKSRKPHSHPKEYPEWLRDKIREMRLKTQLGPDVLTILLKQKCPVKLKKNWATPIFWLDLDYLQSIIDSEKEECP